MGKAGRPKLLQKDGYHRHDGYDRLHPIEQFHRPDLHTAFDVTNGPRVTFELPVLLGPNVKGEFEEIEGLVEIDTEKKEKNKALFSVKIDSIKMNYNKYRDLLLSEIFFYESKFPLVLIDTKIFTYQDQKELELLVELSIKGIVLDVPLKLTIIPLADFIMSLF